MSATTAALLAQATRLFPNYRQYPVVLARGEGSRVWDSEGREYADFVAGIATCNLGHCHPGVTEALREQVGRLVHVSNWYFNEPALKLAHQLTELTFAERVFLCNSGAEANEAAIKLCRKRAMEAKGPGHSTIVSLYGAFHGRTMKALTATDPKHHHPAFAPYPEGFCHLQPGDLAALEAVLPRACALFLEPVQGEGGVRPLDPAFVARAAELCRAHDVLLVFDEVQTGMGRCGAPFAYQALGVEPDVMTLAKALGNGFPIGAVLARERVASHFGPGTHGSTFGGNPLASVAALATLDALMEDELPRHAHTGGQRLLGELRTLCARHPQKAVEARGMGMLLGLELAFAAAPVAKAMLERGFLVTVVQERTIRLTPPLNVPEEMVGRMLEALDSALAEAKP